MMASIDLRKNQLNYDMLTGDDKRAAEKGPLDPSLLAAYKKEAVILERLGVVRRSELKNKQIELDTIISARKRKGFVDGD